MKLKNFFKENSLVFVYVLLAVLLEVIAQTFVSAKPFFTEFWVTLLVIMAITALLIALPGKKAKNIASLIFFSAQIIIVLAVNVLYKSNGTTFQKELFYQRTDGINAIDGLFISLGLLFICVLALGLYIALVVLDRRKRKKQTAGSSQSGVIDKSNIINQSSEVNQPPKKTLRIACLVLSAVCSVLFCVSPVLNGIAERNEINYYYKLERNTNGNQKYGSTANFLYEMLSLAASAGAQYENVDDAVDFVYSQPMATSEYNGVSAGNNLIMIMAESFDTHVLERYSKEETALLFPNITKLIGDGVVGQNFRQKEKTDISECISLLGHYPQKKFINVSGGYSQNSYPFSLPNLFRSNSLSNGINPQINSFHDNNGAYYNRDNVHMSLGFDEFYSSEDMMEFGMEGLANGLSVTNKNLDSLAVETMKDVMFPADKTFFTFFTTLTMHGSYPERDNLKSQGFYDFMDECGLFPKGNDKEAVWRNYAATVMDFDKSLGIMMDDLDKKGLLDNTSIIIFSDHNTYFNELTFYAKNIVNSLDAEGFRLPFILFDKKLNAALEENGQSRAITKFTTTADILPTVCDLFGIKAWQNMYLGGTMFDNSEESVVFSRAYNFFFNDNVSFYNIFDVQWAADDFTEEDLNGFIERARTHLDRLYYIDKLYTVDYFKTNAWLSPA